MQVQQNIFGTSQAHSSSVLSSNTPSPNIKPNSSIDAAQQVERAKRSQGLDSNQIESVGVNRDDVDSQLEVQLFEQTTPEQLESRLGAKLEYERALQGSDGAVAHYLANEHAAAREEIQQMVGIDTYA
ncbi:hypothetical protein HWQ46_02180 [Shewanella sp. D64]|uniref:hypothetical protein n=1 Tax=unclassified Shewanella TaxID=196818 RepID=UPI0022BA2159|nr:MULTISPECIES: hypothetical protein [unclassified Shewanella]MEC4724355.1 hypothetical protein [Shewanella sp. D64]MEC4738867.1 hypothetical protein [Shewanella sp. E94]WBJ97696.1 hypothetical protein HWQ47_11675 [Shewanella sp. MTB7]